VRVALALAALAALVVPTGSLASQAGRERAAPKRCAKALKAKPAKRVRRCARVRRHPRARPTAERLVALKPPSTPGGQPGGPVDPGEGTPAPPPVRFVSVRALEFSLTLSRPKVDAGPVTIELRNNGEDPHNLVVSPDDGSHTALATWADTDPAAILRKTVTLGAGRYQLWCSILDHEAQGMTVDLVVE
jgi:hypothetical protein